MGFTDMPAPAPGGYAPPSDVGLDMSAMSAPAPAVLSPAGGMGMGGADDPFSGVPVPSGDAYASLGSGIPEPTALREWEEKHERELEETMRKEETEKKERRAKAQEEIKA